jgi:hypothetical protein
VDKLIQLWTQHQTALAAGVVVVLVLVLLVARAGRRKLGKKIDPELAEDLCKGNYEAAAERELKAGRLDAAYDLFLRAQQPMRAAPIAVRQGRLQDAAELFEKAGSRKRAADLYAQVGMKTKAEELLAEQERVVREREEQKAVLRKRLEEEPEEDIASLDRSPPPAAKPAPVSLDSSDVARPTPAPDLERGSASKPATPSLLGLHVTMDETAEKAASQALALAATQASMASVASEFAKSTVSRGVEQEALAPRHAPDSAVSNGSQGPSVEEPQAAPVARGGRVGAEDTLHQLGASSSASLPSLPARPATVEPVSPAQPGPPPFGEDLSLGEAKPVLEEPSFGEAKPAEENLSLDGHPPAPESNGPIVEGLPEVPPRAARTTPRTPRPVVGSGVGAYRLVRPSEPDVFTPPPSLKPSASEGRISGPVGKEALASVQRPAMEHRNATPTPRPALPLGTKPGLGAPAPRTSPKGTVLGIGPTRSGK